MPLIDNDILLSMMMIFFNIHDTVFMMFGKRNKPYIYVHIIFWGDFSHEKNISHDSLQMGARERERGGSGRTRVVWVAVVRSGR